MITVESLASSSNGNLYRITSGRHQLLLEAGLPISEIKKRLCYQLSRLDGCFITHEHGDHSTGARRLADAGVQLYMTLGTAKALKFDYYKPAEELACGGHVGIVSAEEGTFTLKNFWQITPFKVIHDAAEPVGYMIADGYGDTLVFATDTYVIPVKFKKINVLMIECNYAPGIVQERLEEGSISRKQADRLLHSHMSINSVVAFLRANKEALKDCRQIYLLHGSARNGMPKLFKDVVQGLTGIPTVVCER